MVVSKPASRGVVWLGKWFGVCLLSITLLIVSSAVVYGLVFWRLNRGVAKGDFSAEEMAKVRHEILVGRRRFEPQGIDFVKLARQRYEELLSRGKLQDDHDKTAVLSEIHRQIKTASTEVPYQATRIWVFPHVKRPDDPETPIHLRYRHYVGSTSKSSQRVTEGVWAVRDPSSEGGRGFVPRWEQIRSGAFHELPLPASMIDGEGTVMLAYTNADSGGKSMVFQVADGPFLLVRRHGFLLNFVKASILAVLQLAFLAALGCAVGGALSTPVALFFSAAYIVIGMGVHGAMASHIKTDDVSGCRYSGLFDRGLHYIHIAVDKSVVSVDDFDASSDLIKGHMIGMDRLLGTLVTMILVRGLPLAGLGIWAFSRRELGTVTRKA